MTNETENICECGLLCCPECNEQFILVNGLMVQCKCGFIDDSKFSQITHTFPCKKFKPQSQEKTGSTSGENLMSEARNIALPKIPDTHKGCGEILSQWNFGRFIELRCGDLVWDEVRNIKQYIYCSKCENQTPSVNPKNGAIQSKTVEVSLSDCVVFGTNNLNTIDAVGTDGYILNSNYKYKFMKIEDIKATNQKILDKIFGLRIQMSDIAVVCDNCKEERRLWIKDKNICQRCGINEIFKQKMGEKLI